ncbi:hypothetical protein CMI37_07655 [Candidatus Pacearchaeota archaeon]|nr:hypothetical protein [Candidatus Pacearchaeota archaeon]
MATQDQIDSAYFDLVEADEQDFGPVTVEHFGAYPPEQGLIPLAAYSALSKAGLAEKTDHTDPGKSGYLFPEGVHTYSTFELTELGREWALVGAEEGEPLTGSQILQGMTVAKAKEDEDDLGPPDQDELAGAGVIIEARQHAWRQGGWAVRLADKDLGWYTTIDAAFGSLVDEMETEGQFPNIYQINARGNVDWLDLEGNILRSWV